MPVKIWICLFGVIVREHWSPFVCRPLAFGFLFRVDVLIIKYRVIYGVGFVLDNE
jgi:hypothetical protein